MSLNTKKPSFLMNVLTIIFAQIAVKLLGFAYRMVITNVPGFGDIGISGIRFTRCCSR